jgi:hypothetical protein
MTNNFKSLKSNIIKIVEIMMFMREHPKLKILQKGVDTEKIQLLLKTESE